MNNEVSVERYQNLLKRKASLEAQISSVHADQRMLDQKITETFQKWQVSSVEEARVKTDELETLAINTMNNADRTLDKAQADVNNYLSEKARANIL